ncbi:sugar ABC transporter permease [Subtercola sp. RTI3]|uniref:carbohydrate ABC transporter permease n=1 Tax=Subtercola sp. RTI3 TaxID=3048639 RepID=UPI002B224D5C|nr:sugar ABC transporter permease [Subtercola sp. RTI3]MEA9985629.1 sugar ABC transporter permease [Subtercola sp. RTI3]
MAYPIVETPRQLQRNRLRSSRRRQTTTHPAWFLLPAFAVLGVFFFLPTIFNFIYAFTDWSAFKNEINFIGFDNFSSLLSDGSLFSALRVTLIYAALVGILQNLFGLGLAVLFERDTRINRFARVIFFIPVLMSALAVGYIFQALLKPSGAVNGILEFFTGQHVDIAWLGDTTWTLLVVAFVNSWKWMGLAMIIFLAGLKTVPEDVLEAAKMDGAGPWKTFFRVKFPLLAPAVTFNFATALLGSLNGFDTVQATTGGGPAQTTEVLNIYIFQIFGYGLYAQATTMSLVLFFLVLVLAFPVVGYLRRRENVL